MPDARVPGRSAVLLGRSNGDDGLLQSREIYELPLKGALIVLSGCRTADGRFSAAEGLHSLSRAFLQAGGRTVVGSLWDLPDDSAASMMMCFYTDARSERALGRRASVTDVQAAIQDRTVDVLELPLIERRFKLQPQHAVRGEQQLRARRRARPGI